ncbi:sugar O-acetyltransferase [Enterococcus sp. AZ109]|uniref:sugar O-acetyltransferase n=1 Tax=Enterococcus sp. AZ109 TaxID=2774634 RepID=UPI003F245A69
MVSELEKMHTGAPFNFLDPQISLFKEKAARLCKQFNEIDPGNLAEQKEILSKLFGKKGENIYIQAPFYCDVGKNIQVGEAFLTNYNVKILDVASVTIGDYCMIGPNTVITSVGHPLDAKGRREHLSLTDPVVIGNDVWIGANCVILPGVTIGNNVVVAAGAVVTKNVPDNCVVAGVPAQVIRDLTEEQNGIDAE